MPIEQARAQGAMALFGEKYPDIVRVVQMGDFSRELCGGTHLDSVGQVGLFKIVGEESVAAGTRRITALTGKAALDYVRQEEEILAELAATLRVPPARSAERVAALLEEIKTLKKQASQRPRRGRRGHLGRRLARRGPGDRPGPPWSSGPSAATRPTRCASSIDVLRRKRPDRLAVLLASTADGKVQLVAGLSQDLVDAGPARRELAQGGCARSSAAAAADGPTSPRPAARSPTRSRPLWRRPSRSSAPASRVNGLDAGRLPGTIVFSPLTTNKGYC